jgi:hypothetical protein
MKLLKVAIPKSKLVLIPEDERIFFVQLTYLLNELYILQKSIYFSTQETSNVIERKGRNSQALFFVRIQAGKLFEGWELLQKKFFSTKISQKYEIEFSDLGRNSLTELKRYFGKENIISMIRNEFAFHYSHESSDKIKELILDVPDSEVFEMYLSEEHGNCLYDISQVLVNIAILNSIDSSDTQKALEKILQEVHQVTKWFLDFGGDCVLIIMKNSGLQHGEIEIPDPPSINEVILPYFVRKE